MKSITAISMGSEVERLLTEGGRAQIIGSTSKGIFLLARDKRVVFLSYEGCRSPLTLNLGRVDESLRRVEIGEEAELSGEGLFFPEGRIRVLTGKLTAWEAGNRAGSASPPGEIAARVKTIATGIVLTRPDIGFSPLVASLVLGRQEASRLTEDLVIARYIQSIFAAGAGRNLSAALEHMQGILGFGRGLTPSGDDLALGFLLALNRWGQALGYPPEAVVSFNQALIAQAERRTTSLSVAMIRLAARGEGDERQLNVVDGLMTGEPKEAKCLEFVLQMGNSSGIDSFLGMAAGIL